MRITTRSGRRRAAQLGAVIRECRTRIRALLVSKDSAGLLTAAQELDSAQRELKVLPGQRSERPRKHGSEVIAEVHRQRAAKLSIREIAWLTHLPVSSVHRILKTAPNSTSV